ncbi:arv1 [Anaeramoeba ignava]|uniref:Protein ARV n=1 Tax=Anaeramoeba ignava TaxID=1746090 RepID=A0A9Q0R6Z2_ANAIG|nr:arv1 [Anaeramoeba ignava]
MLCVHCGHPITQTYRKFQGGQIRLNICPHCHHRADEYIELDNVVKFLDLILLKKEVYRHILFNHFDYQDKFIQKIIIQLAIVMILFITYSKMVFDQRSEDCSILYNECDNAIKIFSRKVKDKLFYFILESAVEMIAYITGILFAIRIYLFLFFRNIILFKYNYVVIALIFSSFGQLFLILPMIWNYNINFFKIIDYFVIISNIVAICVVVEANFLKSGLIVMFGLLFKYFSSKYSINWLANNFGIFGSIPTSEINF